MPKKRKLTFASSHKRKKWRDARERRFLESLRTPLQNLEHDHDYTQVFSQSLNQLNQYLEKKKKRKKSRPRDLPPRSEPELMVVQAVDSQNCQSIYSVEKKSMPNQCMTGEGWKQRIIKCEPPEADEQRDQTHCSLDEEHHRCLQSEHELMNVLAVDSQNCQSIYSVENKSVPNQCTTAEGWKQRIIKCEPPEADEQREQTHCSVEEEPHRCLQCGKGFSSAWTLINHKETHSGDMPYLCHECGKVFTCYSDLRAHMSIHNADITTGPDKQMNESKPCVIQHKPKRFCRLKGVTNGDVLSGMKIPPLYETPGDIGRMNHICKDCGAHKWSAETSSSCCLGGKVILEPFPRPPDLLQKLWFGDSQEARTFQKFSRCLNSALCLSSLKVEERTFDGEFAPPLVIQGRLHHLSGPIVATKGETPRLGQLYTCDPDVELAQRFASMKLPQNTTDEEKETLKTILEDLQTLLKYLNPFVKDFIQIAEIPDEDLEHGQLVISAKERVPAEHEGKNCNLPYNLYKVRFETRSEPQDVVLKKHGGDLQWISSLNPYSLPLHFILLFPYGTKGWGSNCANEDKRLTIRQYLAYHMNKRAGEEYLLRAGRLFQEFLCFGFIINENQKLNFIRRNQKLITGNSHRTSQGARSGQEIEGAMQSDDHRQFLPASFNGSPRWYHKQYLDGMAIVRAFHQPDYCITMKCNPNSMEILQELGEGQTSEDRPDIVSRVFKLKKDQLLKDITQELLGRATAYMWAIDFQDRDLPQIRVLVMINDKDRPTTREQVDNVITAELPPDPNTLPPEQQEQARRLEKLVLDNMVHEPCGTINPEAPCMVDGKCTEHFPKLFQLDTVINSDSCYPRYKRRSPLQGGRQITIFRDGKEVVIDNSWIVPYNACLLLRYEAHIKVEKCTSSTAVKDLYIRKPRVNDRTFTPYRGEIDRYVDLRSVGPHEAVWKMMSFNITKRYPVVLTLGIHLESTQRTDDKETKEETAVKAKGTHLTAFFDHNKKNAVSGGRQPCFIDMPKFCIWDYKQNKWKDRERMKPIIGRVNCVYPSLGDLFYLRMLLHHHHCKGKTSFKDLRTVNGVTRETFKDVCSALGLIQDDDEWYLALSQGASTKMYDALRELFVTLLQVSFPEDPANLFQENCEQWTEDIRRDAQKKGVSMNESQLDNLVLNDIELRLQRCGMTTKQFGLPEPTAEDLQLVDVMDHRDPAIQEELQFDYHSLVKEVSERQLTFTAEQHLFYDTVLNAVKNDEATCVFLDSRGGCGKTYVLNTVLGAVRILEPDGCVALATATTGIAANLLALGGIFHSRLKAPISPQEDDHLNISTDSKLAKLIKMSKLLVIDEASMLHRYHLEAMDKTFREILENDRPFGGKVIVLAGDFRQWLPNIQGGERTQVIDTCINRSVLWKHFKVMQLTVNMRLTASEDLKLKDFDKWTQSIGDGSADSFEECMINIRYGQCVDSSSNTVRVLDDFTNLVYPNLETNYCDEEWVKGRVILAASSHEVGTINNRLLQRTDGELLTFYSADMVDRRSDVVTFSVEYLNILTPSDIPEHELKLKKGIPVRLLLNLNPKDGLCQGSRLQFICALSNKLLQCRILDGQHAGRMVLIPRVQFRPKEGLYSFGWTRRQFPLQPAFCTTIDNVQGQTLKQVGLWLKEPFPRHGQLYVALSRVEHPDRLYIATPTICEQFHRTRNVVYPEAFPCNSV